MLYAYEILVWIAELKSKTLKTALQSKTPRLKYKTQQQKLHDFKWSWLINISVKSIL